MFHDNLDEIPIAGVTKTFEELLEEKLREEGTKNIVQREFPKKEFLKKKQNPSYYIKEETQIDKPKKLEESKPIVRQKSNNLNKELPDENFSSKVSQNSAGNNGKKSFLKKGEGKICLNAKPEKADSKNEIVKPPPKNVGVKPIEAKAEVKVHPKTIEKPVKNFENPVKNKTGNDETIYYDLSALEYDEIEVLEKPVEKSSQNILLEEYNKKLLMINEEVQRFKSETALKKKANKVLKSNLCDLEAELEGFIDFKNNRVQELSSYKENEIKRIKRERLNLEKNCKAQQPTKSEEIEDLRLLLFKVQEELAIKEFKDKEKLDELSQELSALNSEINEYETQVKIREQLLIKDNFKKPKNPNEKVFKNGTRMRNFPDGRCIINFLNGDTKETHPDGTIIYQYNKDQITQITLPDGTEISEFSNGQIEKVFPNGKKEITFPNGSVQVEYSGKIR